tara:strand:- start:13265 stop:14428 length:1164 start_codon:yes stop_codon:yes gene_type:complete
MSQDKKNTFTCVECHEKYNHDSVVSIEVDVDGLWCEDCYYEHYCSCDACGEHVLYEESHSAWDAYYCEYCFNESYIYCESCNEVEHRDDASYSNDYYYCQNCYGGEQILISRLENLKLPISSRLTEEKDYSSDFPVNRMVGIEVECLIPDEDGIDTPEYWTTCSDGSINTSDFEGFSGVEMVSYPANSIKLLDSIVYLMDWKDKYNAIINRSCGLHVHFNSLDMTPREVAHVGIVYKFFQGMLKDMMPNSRQDSNWCRDFELDNSSLRNVETEDSLIDLYYNVMMNSIPSTEKYNDARYCALNIHSRYYHGSLEFRLHSGTINQWKIVNWISILNIIINKGIEISKYKDDKFEEYISSSYLEHIVPTFGEDLSSYINKRIAKFKGDR